MTRYATRITAALAAVFITATSFAAVTTVPANSAQTVTVAAAPLLA